MSGNLFVSYDLMNQKNYDAVINAIKTQGQATRVHYSLWYVKTNKSANDVAVAVWQTMDSDDRLIVIDANEAYWFNAEGDSESFMQSNWR
jgi:hypothetical protein